MSFSSEVKRELGDRTGTARHCQIAELAALIDFCGDFVRTDAGETELVIATDHEELADHASALLRKAFRIQSQREERPDAMPGGRSLFLVGVPEPGDVRRVLMATRFLTREGGLVTEIPLVHQVILQKDCCRRAFLRGAFLAAGSVSDPRRSYHFEIVCRTEYTASQLMSMIRELDIDARYVRRKKYQVVYVKEGEEVSELLGLMGAVKAMMNFENARIVREVRGNVNRQVNCETANIGKTAAAAARQIENIQLIDERMGLSKLPNALDEVARVRLQYPEATLQELGKYLDPPVGKSGVNHRLRKLNQIAESLRLNAKEDAYDKG